MSESVFVSARFVRELKDESDDWRGDGNPWLCFTVKDMEIIIKRSDDEKYEITEGFTGDGEPKEWSVKTLKQHDADDCFDYICLHIPKLIDL